MASIPRRANPASGFAPGPEIPVFTNRPALDETGDLWRARLSAVLARGHFILGEEVSAFETEFALAMGGRHAIGVSSGTSAIELSLRDAGVTSRRQEVITSPLTAAFTGLAVFAAGATPRFADIDPETLQLDCGDAENRIRKQTAALLPVHLYGQPCHLNRFRALARSRAIALVQDACQAHGARYRGRPLAAYSDYVAYSFYPTKNLGGLGDGGAIVTNSALAARRLRLARNGGRGSGPNIHVSRTMAGNSRLDELQAAFLRAFLPRLEAWNARRARLAAIYDEMLAGCGGVRQVRRFPCSVNHLYVIRAKRRKRLREFLSARGTGSAIHYPVPLHLQPAFRGCGLRRGDLPEAERACREILTLPLWPQLAEDAVRRVASQIRAFYGNA